MKKSLLILFAIVFLSCSNDDDESVDCSTIDCIPADQLKLNILKNDINIFDINPELELTITQNNQEQEYTTNENIIYLYVYGDTPILIAMGDDTIELSGNITTSEGECCTVYTIDQVYYNNSTICDGGAACDEVLTININ